MKHFLIAFFILLVANLNAQEEYLYSGWGKIRDSHDYKVTPSEFRNINATNFEILQMYNTGRTQQAAGNTLLISGGGLVIWSLTPLFSAREYNYVESIIGGALLAIAIPVKLGFKKKIERAAQMTSDNHRRSKTAGYIDATQFKIGANGIGFVVSF